MSEDDGELPNDHSTAAPTGVEGARGVGDDGGPGPDGAGSMTDESTYAGPRPYLRVRVEGTSSVLRPDREWHIGRGRAADVSVDDTRVSRRHVRLAATDAGWVAVDAGSRNGVWLDGSVVERVTVPSGGLRVRLGDPDGPAVELLPVGTAPTTHGNSPGTDAGRFPVGPGTLTLGRKRDNDIVLDDLLVSRHHAVLTCDARAAVLRDLSSANGTFVNGRRIDEVALRPGDTVVIGSHSLTFTGDALEASVIEGDLPCTASHLRVDLPDGTRLLDDVSFALPPRTLMAVVGPSGAGKSTLLGALTGAGPATSGTVRYGGYDLATSYDALRQQIGVVPQQDILHQTLTVRKALTFGARLRFPPDTAAAERAARILEVATDLHLRDRLDTRIRALSGGERKRASTALELLTKPSFLFLDEPTSGLDTDLDREVMGQLRDLADNGRTVVVVTHNLEHLSHCDLVLLLARGGHVAYLGPPDRALAFFDAASWADVFSLLKTRPGKEWAERFAADPRRDPRALPVEGERAPRVPQAAPPGARRRAGTQFTTLVARNVAVIASDRTLLAILALLPVVLALIARVVPGAQGLSAVPGNMDAQQLLLVLIIGAFLVGTGASVREIVKERPIFRRERAVGLSPYAYVAAKTGVVVCVAAVQSVLLTVLALVGRPRPTHASLLPSSTAEIVVAVALTAAVSAIGGLTMSALVREENQAMPLLVLATMGQLVLCGGLVPLVGRPVLAQVSWLMPTRWGFAATASTVDLQAMNLPPLPPDDRLWHHGTTWWLVDVVVLCVLGLAALALLLRIVTVDGPSRARRR